MEGEGTASPQRWWQRRPAGGVAFSLAVGAATLWIASALQLPEARDAAVLSYLVSLPIALLLPTLSAAGLLIGWQAWRAAAPHAWLVVPTLLALLANACALALFLRVMVRLLQG
ncbi:MAG TPA: hypothetical protein VNM24_08020 [Burkholderiales bacterium]|nr:hypothetical protein [Burkholderiales bacterium]